jgi:hypothetical protein
MGLIELYRDILISTNTNANDILIGDVTSYICERGDGIEPLMVPEKRIPAPRRFELNLDRVREIDIDAPEVITNVVEKRIVPHHIVTDSIKH